ncbi:hypothetical protein Tco_1025572 [Tanacetum coccineum]
MEYCNPVVTPMELGTKLSKFKGGEPVDTDRYRSLVGSLRYLTCTRPDLAYNVGVVSRFIEKPKYAHWKALMRILRYVKGTESLALFYSNSKEYILTAFTWALKKQPVVALSTCEEEYVAASWTSTTSLQLSWQGTRYIMREVNILMYASISLRNRDVQLTHVMSHDQAADIFTKALLAKLFNLCKKKMGMKDARDVSLREEFDGK